MIRVSKNLNRRIQLLQLQKNQIQALKNNKQPYTELLVDYYSQLKVAKELMKKELVLADIGKML